MSADNPLFLRSEMRSDEPRADIVDTIVIHSMYNPSANDPLSPEACKQILDQYEVSSHYIIGRDGRIYLLVEEDYLAWHAGKSTMPEPDGREGVNKFSIGIELVASENSGVTNEQYKSLAKLSVNLQSRHPIINILGHHHIAPDRKSDPWNFDWNRFKQELKQLGQINNLNLPL